MINRKILHHFPLTPCSKVHYYCGFPLYRGPYKFVCKSKINSNVVINKYLPDHDYCFKLPLRGRIYWKDDEGYLFDFYNILAPGTATGIFNCPLEAFIITPFQNFNFQSYCVLAASGIINGSGERHNILTMYETDTCWFTIYKYDTIDISNSVLLNPVGVVNFDFKFSHEFFNFEPNHATKRKGKYYFRILNYNMNQFDKYRPIFNFDMSIIILFRHHKI